MRKLNTGFIVPIMAAAIMVAVVGCGGGEQGPGSTKEAKGGVSYGGVFRMNETEDFRTLYPLNIVEVVGHRIGSQVYEGLTKFNQKDLSIMPGLARRWDELDSSKRFVFYLRKGVRFHDDACFADGKGREVTTKDVKFCFDKLCEVTPTNQQFSNTFKDRVVGANDSYDKKAKGVAGVTITSDSTIEIKLTQPMPSFPSILATQGCWIYPEEALTKYGDEMRIHCVGTGPFKVKIIKEGESVILDRNPNYWMFDQFGNRLPYLDIVQFKFIKDKRSEIIAFRNQELDMVFRLPVEMAKDIMGELDQAKQNSANFVLQSAPAMSLTYYGFQHKLAPFDNVKVRMAFNYAINRKFICDKVLNGDATPAIYGIVPPSIPNYNNKSVAGFTYDPDRAKKLMAEAGFPNGKGFPEVTMQINSGGGDRNTMTAEYIKKQLEEVLGVVVKIDIIPFAQHLEALETGKALFWRTGWIADYPDPETFLTILYSQHIPAELNTRSSMNSVRYSSTQFDSAFVAAVREPDPVKRNALYLRADQIAMNDAAIMPIYYEQNDRLVHRNVRNFDINAMEYRDMTAVWIDTGEGKKDSAK